MEFNFNELMFFLAPAGALLALLFAALQAKSVFKFSEGTDKMKEIAKSVREGAGAFLKRQYTGVAVFFGIMVVVLGVMSFFGLLNVFTPFAFLTGGLFSGTAGFLGMKIATSANARTAQAASEGLNKGLRVAFASGSVMGFIVVGLGLFDLSVWYFLLKYVFFPIDGVNIVDANAQIAQIAPVMLTFGIGASSMALFARVGGGVFTKAADVGADLVGKVEAGIPEDDPRNPAVIADNVGDNVGDVAGMGADLYESYVISIVATLALAVPAFFSGGEIVGPGPVAAAAVPLVLAAVGVLVSIIGTFFVRTGEDASQKSLLKALRKGSYVASGLVVAAAFPVVWFLLGQEFIGVYFAILSGLVAGVLISTFTEYYTSDTYKPTQKLSESSQMGAGPILINGLSLGMLSTVAPVVIVGISVMVSFFAAGGSLDFSEGLFGGSFAQGLYGVGLSAVAMLSTLGITLASDAYGPVADNAGGIAEMAEMDPKVRERTDALDSLGNTTAATGKGFAIGSAGLAALTLIVAYIERVRDIIAEGIDKAGLTAEAVAAAAQAEMDKIMNLQITNPQVLIGLLIGAVLPFLFSALTMKAVGRAAQSIVVEVRRQFKEIKGLMEGKAKADYKACVDLCTKSAQKEMVPPAVIVVVVPVVVGLLLGVSGVVGMLAGSLAAGFIMAIMMANAGGAWDNAKKYIEAGNLGGKGSDAHKAAVVGDTVGDPFKDTSGPGLNVLIKLLSIVSIVFAGLIIAFSQFMHGFFN
ncbi:MAG: sodium-translocating pyrophosphatase [Oscillospiraceae bacterium]|nr:sodium-translocating pyrophosphatase [Oscillospiraceae bacterium]